MAKPLAAVAYYRVSTVRQGRSGLGLDAQRSAVRDYLTAEGRVLVDELVEVETGTAKRSRPVLAQAIERCRLTGARLVIAKLDRLARNVAFVSSLMEAGVDFVALDCPTANRFTIHILAAVAEHESRMISERTRLALAAAKRRGRILGNAEQGTRNLMKYRHRGAPAARAQANARAQTLAGVIAELRPGRSLEQLATALNERHIRTPRGASWHAASVARLLARLAPAPAA